MAPDTAWATRLLDEAAAIVEAEWMRVQQDEALWERSSLTCSPRCLRPGPPRPASASPPPGAGAPGTRCRSTVAGGRNGDGPPHRCGPPNGPLRHTRAPC